MAEPTDAPGPPAPRPVVAGSIWALEHAQDIAHTDRMGTDQDDPGRDGNTCPTGTVEP